MSCFVFNHFSTHVGWIKDISIKGLSFEYLHKPGSDCNPEVVDIFSNGNGLERFYIESLPCQRIYDIALPLKSTSWMEMQARRCGIEYVEPTEDLVNKIDTFIISHMRGVNQTDR